MGKIILEQVDHVVEVNEAVIDGDNVHFARVQSHPGDQAPNTTKSVDSGLHLHHGTSEMQLEMHEKMRLSVEWKEQRAKLTQFFTLGEKTQPIEIVLQPLVTLAHCGQIHRYC